MSDASSAIIAGTETARDDGRERERDREGRTASGGQLLDERLAAAGDRERRRGGTLKTMISIIASQNGGKPMPKVETMRTT